MKYVIGVWLGLWALSTAAQTTKGAWMLGTTVGISTDAPYNLQAPPADNHFGINYLNTTYKTGDFKETENATLISFAPAVGYFVADQLMLGLNVNLAYADFEGGDVLFTTFLPNARFYINASPKVQPFVEGRGGVTILAQQGEFPRSSIYLVGGRGGAALFLNEAVSLDFFLDYIYAIEPENTDRDIPKTTNSGFGLGIGFSYFLSPK